MVHFRAIGLVTMMLCASDAMAQSHTPQRPEKPVTVYTGRAEGPPREEAAVSQLLQRAEKQGRIRVIVGLKTTMRDNDKLPPSKANNQSRELRRVQDAVADRVLGSASAEGVVRYASIPFMSMFVNPDQLRRLLADPAVASIQQDIPVPPATGSPGRQIDG